MRRLDDEEIERRARALRARLGIDDQDRPCMANALAKAKAEGIINDYVSMDSLPDGEAKFDPHQSKLFISKRSLIAAKNGSVRERFTIAHEFGHLDHTRTRYRRFATDAGGYVTPSERTDESEANRFAGAFLMPAHRVNFNQKLDVAVLIRQFGVSETAARIRLPILEKLHRRATGAPRPLPAGVIDLLRSLQGNGRPLQSLRAHERAYGAPKYEGDQCPNLECGEFTMVRRGTYLQCDLCGTKTGDD